MSSLILQSEILCVPTLWIVIDVSVSGFVERILDRHILNDKTDTFFAYLRAYDPFVDTKKEYMDIREGIIQRVIDVVESDHRSKNRIVIWVAGEVTLSNNMSSLILQSEILCVPTLWIVIDVSVSGFVERILDRHILNDKTDTFFAYLRAYDPFVDTKKEYMDIREGIIQRVIDVVESDHRSKNRIVIWVVGEIEDNSSSFLLRELPLDISNRFYWSYKHIPSILRFSIPGPTKKVFNRYLSYLKYQYYHLPEFDVQNEEKDTNNLTIYGNQYDSCVVGSEEDITEIFDFLIELHLEETAYACENLSFIPHSGGELFIVNGLVSSVSNWRRIDWLSTTQVQYFKRLWLLSSQKHEFMKILDYRSWKARFIKLDPGLIDSLTKEEKTLKREKREPNWDKILDDNKIIEKRMPIYKEKNFYRITGDNVTAYRSLCSCLYRRKNFDSCVRTIDNLNSSDPGLLKIKGMAMIKMGDESGKEYVHQYRVTLEEELSSSRVSRDIDKMQESIKCTEIAKMALLEDAYETGRENIKRSLELTPHSSPAMKILTWICMKSEETDFFEQDIVFKYLLNLPDQNAASEYYQHVLEKYPSNPFYSFFSGLYTYVILKDLEKSEVLIERAFKSLPDHARVMETYATFLFQTNRKCLVKIERLYEKSLEIEPCLHTKTNFAGFLLAKRHKDSFKYQKGLHLLDEVLYNPDIVHDLTITLEAWFYSLVYKPLSNYVKSLQKIKTALKKGGLVPGWDFNLHIERAKKE
eukprot:TRINITY_DN11513_c0_g1_i1.p1 TRINITY_DN11513_c0_g1~~TRINITY_DN11513_c0_g1_i1.p1  ORF type:complete len:769 (+),score=140.61 TRINITY_DN11513_c0_g1_i1:50-2308(+)